jgi:hypothetical protein
MIQMDIPDKSYDGMTWRWAWVAEFAKKYGWTKGAELGVKRGHFSVYLVDHVPDLSMIAVDLWDQKGNSPRYARYRHENNYNRVIERTAGRPIRVLRMSTHEAADAVPDKSLDFAFIDASHEYASVKQDIDDWLPKVRFMLTGHDYPDPEVRKAVQERFTDIIEGPDQCWAVQL